MTTRSNKFTAAMKEGPARGSTAPRSRQASFSRRVKHIGGYFTLEFFRQLRMIAANEDTSMQSLLAESPDIPLHSRQSPAVAENLTSGWSPTTGHKRQSASKSPLGLLDPIGPRDSEEIPERTWPVLQRASMYRDFPR